MPAGTTLALLVEEFVATMLQHGVAIDGESVEQEIRERIDAIATRLQEHPETVLQNHVHQGWGRQMAEAVLDQIQREHLLQPAPADSLVERRCQR